MALYQVSKHPVTMVGRSISESIVHLFSVAVNSHFYSSFTADDSNLVVLPMIFRLPLDILTAPVILYSLLGD